jgi:GNAT superfamily N-acetyltransferase
MDATRVPAEAVAEDLDAYLPARPPMVRAELPGAVVVDYDGPTSLHRVATLIRFGDAARGEIDAVRGWFRERGHEVFTWNLGWRATPPDLERQLRALGARDNPIDPVITAMVLDHPPAAAPGPSVHVIETYADYVAGAEIALTAFLAGFGDEDRAAMRARFPARYEAYRSDPASRRFLATIDGVPVALGTAALTTAGPVALAGGATLPEARGQGAYRALVRARWDYAAQSGAPVLVVQASSASRPILERLGFRTVGRVVQLTDATG